MEQSFILRLIGNSLNRNAVLKKFQSVLGTRLCSSNSDTSFENEKPTFYNRRGGKSGNFNKYYSNENAYTFDSLDNERFNRERKGEYYAFESFMDNKSRRDAAFVCLKEINWETKILSPIRRDLYDETEIVKNRSPYEVNNYRDAHNLILKGSDVPNPILHFSDYKFPKFLQRALDEKGFESPMPIQSQTWPIALSGRDLIGIGQTGSGKTLGFVLPAIVSALNQTVIKGCGPSAVILAPTRELVQQIASVIEEITKYSDINTVCLYGGLGKRIQINQLLSGPLICVSTPGRLLDMLELRVINLENCTYFVLDEADRMLDMGFEPQITMVSSQIRPDRQTLMWSATWPEEIRSLADTFLRDPIRINVGSGGLFANPDIEQTVIITDNVGKMNALRDIIRNEMKKPNVKILIFTETKKMATTLNMRLQRKSIPCSDLHGDHDQIARNRVINAFRHGIINIVIATDVASRGIDVNDISLVINFVMPKDIESYVHRIGRTGRAGKSGRSITFFTNEDKKLAGPLLQLLRQTDQHIPKELHSLCRSS